MQWTQEMLVQSLGPEDPLENLTQSPQVGPRSCRKAGKGVGRQCNYVKPGFGMDGGAWWAAVHEVAKSQTHLRDCAHTHSCFNSPQMETISSLCAFSRAAAGITALSFQHHSALDRATCSSHHTTLYSTQPHVISFGPAVTRAQPPAFPRNLRGRLGPP